MRRHRRTRSALWAMLTVAIALSSLALAAGPKPKGAGKGGGKARPHVAVKDAGATAPASDAASDLSAGDGGSSVDVKVLDSGARVLRFGELEIEGRLRSPQIVYFLRRVRAEFAAEDLGHRTFMRELSETRKEPNF
ncbi:hypothetical protein LZC95_52765 [Pendulispora brunnea]|uniref:POTRA domain-containing protein n=1 Tax=Pendulispora brunnea TaxID=2905690 RepID=A0ABZ2K8W9_9BACT